MNITLSFDRRAGAGAWWDKVPRAAVNAIQLAGGDAIRTMQIESGRRIRERKAMKLGNVKKALPITYPSSKDATRLVWRLGVKGALVPVSAYPVRQTKKGVSVQINTGSRVLIKSAFLAKMKSGHIGVFRRRGDARLPIKEAFTTRVVDVFKDAGFIADIMARGEAKFWETYRRVLPLEVAKAKR